MSKKNEDRVVAKLWKVDNDPWRVAETTLKALKRYADTKTEAVNYLVYRGYDSIDEYLSGRERQIFAVSGTYLALSLIQNHTTGISFAFVYGDGSVLSTDGLHTHVIPSDEVDGETDKERVLKRLHEYGF